MDRGVGIAGEKELQPAEHHPVERESVETPIKCSLVSLTSSLLAPAHPSLSNHKPLCGFSPILHTL